jgi:hypothetical protein
LFYLANFTNVSVHDSLVDQDDEYEPAPGAVIRCREYNGSLLWSHGNFVARRKRSGCFSFLPAPRTLFFFELLDRDAKGAVEVITCVPIGLYLLASSFMHPCICCHDLHTRLFPLKDLILFCHCQAYVLQTNIRFSTKDMPSCREIYC